MENNKTINYCGYSVKSGFKTFEFTEEQIKMLKDACLVTIALLSRKEEDAVDKMKYQTLLNYINS
jgi:hypothetical protein